MKNSLIGSLILTLTLSGCAAMAQHHQQRHQHQGQERPRLEMMGEHLNLDADQKSRFDAMHKEHFAAMQRLKEEMKSQRDKVRTLLQDDKTSKGQFKEALDRQAELQGQRARLMADHLLQMFELLTPAQRKTFAEHHGRMRHDRDDD